MSVTSTMLMRTLLLLMVLLSAPGCPYSFTGASVPEHLSTISIPLIDDRSGFGSPGLREQMTRELTDQFIADNSLDVADQNVADSILEGMITGVTDAASVVGQGETVTTRRITINTKFSFKDLKLRKTVWEKAFSNWGEYDTTGDIFQQQQLGIQEAIRKISEDVLLQTVSGW
jgi:hypothetical protein